MFESRYKLFCITVSVLLEIIKVSTVYTRLNEMSNGDVFFVVVVWYPSVLRISTF